MPSNWVNLAIAKIDADYQRSADTHLIKLDLPNLRGIDIYLKDESTHPTGSLKHRLARSLFLYALCNGWINETTTIIESSSGSTAVSEAYFVRLIGLPFIAVMPKSTAKKKIQQIEFYGGKCHFVDSSNQIYAESERLAKELNGHYMDRILIWILGFLEKLVLLLLTVIKREPTNWPSKLLGMHSMCSYQI